MKSSILNIKLGLLAMMILGFTACRKDPQPLPAEVNQLAPDPWAVLKGMYLVNEGNMNMNKASLDYLDFRKGTYTKNFYHLLNPEVPKGLGDVANDIGLYGNKLYLVVNISNKVEVLDVSTGRRIGQIAVANGRFIAFAGGKAYVSAYSSGVADPNAANGIVVEIDTTSLSTTRTVAVGRQPEELEVVGNKLYVANSGGYSPPDYESTVSVVDLVSFTEVNRIEAGINLHRLKADQYGDLYVTSRGDYYNIPSKLVVIDTKTQQVKKTFDLAVSNLAIDEDIAYLYATEWNFVTGKNTISYHQINIKDEVLLAQQFITDGTEKNITLPYGIAINPITKEIYVADAKDYVTPGKLNCYTPQGKLKWSVTTGDIPAQMVFVR